ncbi:hypothetical protein CRE_22712 [Caenorhabditis remanei]|uniref:Uncharacterized protein n=1 Tax=Caenorhabditis remanei TaxID=31234 RepID=E3NJT3_CAERE|nr:hypothetical protein CRE_22712 [Caenorhabditis remanei]
MSQLATTAPQKNINETGTGYVTSTQQPYYDQGGMMNTGGIEPIYFSNEIVPKTVKKPETFVFNFNKGSAPVFNIMKEK